ncbi:DUF397 domain-containing protein [Actinoallomurus acanthiterrae]
MPVITIGRWRKSTYSTQGESNCVEVSVRGGTIASSAFYSGESFRVLREALERHGCLRGPLHVHVA